MGRWQLGLQAIRVVGGAIFTVVDAAGAIPVAPPVRVALVGIVLLGLLVWAEIERIVVARPHLKFEDVHHQYFGGIAAHYWRVGVRNTGTPTDIQIVIESAKDIPGPPNRRLHFMGDNPADEQSFEKWMRADTDVTVWADFLSMSRGRSTPPRYALRTTAYHAHFEPIDLPSHSEWMIVASGGGAIARQRFTVDVDAQSGMLTIQRVGR